MRSIIGITFLVLVAASSAVAITSVQTTGYYGSCPALQCSVPENIKKNYQQIGEKYYMITNFTHNWFDAFAYCRSIDADLANLDTQAEYDAMIEYLKSKGLENNWYWIDGNCLGHSGIFVSMKTGKPMRYTKWAKGQPNNAGGNANCIHLWKKDGVVTTKDGRCSYPTYFICQARQPSTITLTVW